MDSAIANGAKAHVLVSGAGIAGPAVAYWLGQYGFDVTVVERAFAGGGWNVPLLLEHLRRARDVYFDSISMVRVPQWWREHVVLLGDAASGGTIGGMGSGVAVIGAYVLAGELFQAETPAQAFARYQKKMSDYAAKCQTGAADVGTFMAPKTRLGLTLRNAAFRAFDVLPGKGLMERLVMKRATGVELSAYR